MKDNSYQVKYLTKQDGAGTAIIRQLLYEALNDLELDELCCDYFWPVYDQFTRGMKRGEKILYLIEYCVRHLRMDELLGLVRGINPARYAQYFDVISSVREKLEELGEQRKLLEAVCILRRFNSTSLKRFATKFVGESYEEQSAAFFLRVLGDFVDSKLVEWSKAASGYVLNAVARRIMSDDLQSTAPNEFEARHQEAIEMYRQMIAESPDQAVLEILYHLGCLSFAKEQPVTESRQSLEKEMALVLREDRLNIDQANNLCEAIRREEELKSQLDEETFNSLCQRVERFRDSLSIET